jgi:mannose/cellobiose epimerase-like protein (N-acyl-D-glucosamine 2-epimerase family)
MISHSNSTEAASDPILASSLFRKRQSAGCSRWLRLHLVNATVNHLLAHRRRDDGFYIHCITADGDMLDNRADLYDQAFIMLCFDHAGKATGRVELFDAADALADTLEGK